MRWLTLLVVLLVTVLAIRCEDEVDTEEEATERIEQNDEDEEDEKLDEEDWLDDGVMILTADNFETYIKENEFVLVEFYAPWCGHCRNFAPEYAKVANQMEEISSPIKVVKVDASTETKYVDEYGVKGYPTVQLFRNGKASEYWGMKQAGNIIDWLNKKTGPVAIDLKSVQDAEEFIKSQDVVVIGFFTDRESDGASEFLGAADSVDDYRFGITSNEDVYRKYESESGSIVLFKKFDEGKAVFEGELTEREIRKFVAINSAPLVIDFSTSYTHSVFGVVENHLLMFISKKEGHMEEYVQPARDAAQQFRGKVLFVAIDCDGDEFQRILSFFNIRKEEVPTMRLIHSVDETKNNKYKPKNADLSPDNIKAFVQDGLDGKLTEDLRSQDLPEDWDKTPVKTLVSSNFDEVVFDKTKDVFVTFYSPWSEESNAVVSVIDELGEKYKDSETVVIGKLDAMANELDPKHAKIISFPTFKFYKRGDNAMSYYAGKRTLDAIVKFIESGGEDVEYDDDESTEQKVTSKVVEDEEKNDDDEAEEEEYNYEREEL